MNENLIHQCALSAVSGIEADMKDRRCLRGVWNDLQPEVLERIRSEWAFIVEAAIHGALRTAARTSPES